MRLLLARHGETAWNENGKFQGARVTENLTERGRRQVAALATAVAPLKPVAIYSSPLPRAMETARAIARPLQLEPFPVDALREMEIGLMEGLTGKEMEERFPEFTIRWRRDPSSVAMPGGESFPQLQARAWAVVEAALKEHPEDTVLFVSHHFTLQSILCQVLGLPLSRVRAFRLDLASLSTVELRDGVGRLLLMNDRCHIPPDDVGTSH
jgi:broad specificity phosphatase PhoE